MGGAALTGTGGTAGAVRCGSVQFSAILRGSVRFCAVLRGGEYRVGQLILGEVTGTGGAAALAGTGGAAGAVLCSSVQFSAVLRGSVRFCVVLRGGEYRVGRLIPSEVTGTGGAAALAGTGGAAEYRVGRLILGEVTGAGGAAALAGTGGAAGAVSCGSVQSSAVLRGFVRFCAVCGVESTGWGG
ncbi:unnamed protein product [Closterium sp. Naga37s-1]|nr:unnamed protein product [Closterium sp. Naga37s-1]